MGKTKGQLILKSPFGVFKSPSLAVKGQLILKCPFGVFKSPKKQT